MIQFSSVKKTIQKCGFRPVTDDKVSKIIYYREKDNRAECVILINAVIADMPDSSGAEQYIAICQETIRDIKRENIFTVFYTDKGMAKKEDAMNCYLTIEGRTVMRANKTAYPFRDLVTKLGEMVKKENMEIENNQIRYGFKASNNYSSWIIPVFIILNIYLFLKTFGNSYPYAISVADLNKGNYFQLLTYQFMHASVIHLVGNCVSLYCIGKALIKRIHWLDFFIIYLFGGIFAGIGSLIGKLYYYHDVSSQTVGSSGAIFALLGAFVLSVCFDKDCINKGSVVKYSALVLLVSAMNRNCDNFCHIGGLFAGGCIYMILFSIHDLIRSHKYFANYGRLLKQDEKENIALQSAKSMH